MNNDSRITEEDIAKLYNLNNLRKLQINGTGVTSLDFLIEDFPYLKELEARKLNKLEDRNQSIFKLAQHPRLKKLTLSKDIKDSLDADAWAAYGMDSTDWFKTQGISVSFK